MIFRMLYLKTNDLEFEVISEVYIYLECGKLGIDIYLEWDELSPTEKEAFSKLCEELKACLKQYLTSGKILTQILPSLNLLFS